MTPYRIFLETIAMLPVIPIYFLGKKVYHRLEPGIKIYWFFLLFAYASQLWMTISSLNRIHNISFSMLFQVIEYTTLSLIFYIWNPNKVIRIIILLFIVVNVSSWIYYFTGDNIDYSITKDKYLRNFILIPLSFITAYKFAIESKTDLLKNIKFWIIGGILVNVTLTAFTQLLQTYTHQIRELVPLYSHFLLLANTIAALMFIKGFLCLKTQMK